VLEGIDCPPPRSPLCTVLILTLHTEFVVRPELLALGQFVTGDSLERPPYRVGDLFVLKLFNG